MASLESRNGRYRIVFRYQGTKFSRSLRTTNVKAAQVALHRLEDNIRRVEMGTLEVPERADLCAFLLSDGRRATIPRRTTITFLAQLTGDFLAKFRRDSVEPNTLNLMVMHLRHIKKWLKPRFQISQMSFDVLQTYVNQRAKDNGRRGGRISPYTIKKEIATLSAVWKWAKRMGYVDRDLPKQGLRYPKSVEKPPFQTWEEIENRFSRGGLSNAEIADLWDCVFLTLPELAQLVGSVESTQTHEFVLPMVAFAAHTGARRSGIIRSRLEDIDLNRRVIVIREKKRVRGTL